jgi:peptidyl-tRNA hydrolase
MIIKMYAVFARETLRQMKFEGKLAAQAGHAYLHAWWDAEERLSLEEGLDSYGGCPSFEYTTYYHEVMRPYRYGDDARKVALVVDTVQELEELYEQFRPHMGATIVDDCGYTVFKCTTTTAVGLGPIPFEWTIGTRIEKLESLKNEIERDADNQ